MNEAHFGKPTPVDVWRDGMIAVLRTKIDGRLMGSARFHGVVDAVYHENLVFRPVCCGPAHEIGLKDWSEVLYLHDFEGLEGLETAHRKLVAHWRAALLQDRLRTQLKETTDSTARARTRDTIVDLDRRLMHLPPTPRLDVSVWLRILKQRKAEKENA